MSDYHAGPTSTLPGSRAALPDGAMCDEHEDRPAAARVQGETDSFGCEYLDLCAECLDGVHVDRLAARIGKCEWCKKDATDLAETRDYEEGLSGPVYRVCGACRRRMNDRAAEELSSYGDDPGWTEDER